MIVATCEYFVFDSQRATSFLQNHTQLALVHMSDHYTRVTTGGSPLKTDAPVVGILFGHGSAIVDAEDIPLDDPTKAVELHQAVFPQNVVVGCYRVTQTEGEPTADDIRQVQALQQAFGGSSSLYFGLLQVNPKGNGNNNNNQEENLPLQLFTLQDNVLVAVQDWHLTTAAAAERIAVERVLRDKPAQDQENEINQAWMALDARLQQLMEYLPTTTTVSPPTAEHLELWRQVQGLLAQAHLLRTDAVSSSNNLLPQNVAVLAKTVDAIAWYTDKFRLLYEVKGR